MKRYTDQDKLIAKYEGSLEKFSQGYLKFGFNKEEGGVVYREWGPAAQEAQLIGDFNGWDGSNHNMTKDEFGVWSIKIPHSDANPAIPHNSRVKFRFKHGNGVWVDRIPAWITYATVDPSKFAASYDGVYWDPTPPERPPGTQPPLCRSDDDPDAVWGVNMKACISPYSEHDHKAQGSGLAPWPARLTSPPPRLADFGFSSEIFEKDTELWRHRVESYWNLLSPKIQSDTIRNVMDMKANMGSFAAALKDRDVWVMNAVSEDGPNTLKLIYDRGLIGTTHSWWN